MRNIGEIKDCYGCGVCATVCGKKIIGIGLNKEGFYDPQVVDPEHIQELVYLIQIIK